jgi:alpha-D-glucose phosphate-specific phosphoglucomutase
MTRIQFGTDGWRGVVNDDFTLDNVRVVAQAIAEYVKSLSFPKRELAVGYDGRALSPESAAAIAEVLAGNGIKALLSDGLVPTPALVYAIKHHQLAGGVMITASHNPPRFNGVKFKPFYAGSADDKVTEAIEGFLWKGTPRTVPLEEAKRKGVVRLENLWAAYENNLKSYVDLRTIGNSRLKVIADPMHGTQGRLLERILAGSSCEVKTIHAHPDPAFGGLSPEPIPPHIEGLQKAVLDEQAAVGLAADADGDRIGAVNSRGEFVTPHQILAMLLLHLYNNRGWKGLVVKTMTTSALVRKVAEDLGLPWKETPVGFKYICEIMRNEDVLIGGEESGGISYKNYFPERDGALSGLLLLELMATQGKKLEDIMGEIDARYGTFRYGRTDIEYPDTSKAKLFDGLQRNPPDQIDGQKVVEVDARDGVKLILDNEDWLMLRTSGTEPIVRIYAEAKSFDGVRKLLSAGNSIADRAK